jgi:IS5 family transposase
MRTAAGKDEARAAVRRLNSELAGLAQTAAKDAERLLVNAKRGPAPGPGQGPVFAGIR